MSAGPGTPLEEPASTLSLARYSTALAEAGELLLAHARRAGLSAPVPTCPGWTVGDLVRHIGFVHQWACGYVSGATVGTAPEPDEATVLTGGPRGPELLGWAASNHAALVAALRGAPADLRCWTFLDAPSPLLFWARRQAHETTVHRADAQLAAGEPVTPVGEEIAIDGIEELLLGFLARPLRYRREGVQPAELRLEAEGSGRAWRVQTGPDGPRTTRSRPDAHGSFDLAVRGPASDLYFLLWNRRSPDGLDLAGRPELLEQWRRQARVRWS